MALLGKSYHQAGATSKHRRSQSKVQASSQYPFPGPAAIASSRISARHSSSAFGQHSIVAPQRSNRNGPASLVIKGERTSLGDDPFVLTHDYLNSIASMAGPGEKLFSSTHLGKFYKGKDIKPLLKGAFSRV